MTEYSWVDSESSWPGRWLNSGCCMTYAAGVSAAEVIEWLAPTEHHRERLTDPVSVEEACSEYESFAVLTQPGWVIIFEPHGFFGTVAEKLAMRSVHRVVCFSWNVEMDTDISVWEHGELQLRFDIFNPDVRLGSESSAFADDIQRANFYNGDTEEGSVGAASFAFAEALTGCRIEPDFLYGDLIWGVR